jgi:hypothetical protein
MTTKISPVVRLNIWDIFKAGNSIPKAIIEWAKESGQVASGPSSTCLHQPDASTYAILAGEGGATAYIDEDDGRMVRMEPADESESEEEGVYTDGSYGYFRLGDWTDESVVELICPDLDLASAYPEAFGEMARAVQDHPLSNRKEWIDLIQSIRVLAEQLEDVMVDQ